MPSWAILVVLEAILDLLVDVLGPSLEPVGQFWKPFGPSKLSEARHGENATIIETIMNINEFGLLGAHLGALLGRPGGILGSPEAILERLEAILGRLRGILGELGCLLDPHWPSSRPYWTILGQLDGHIGRPGGHIKAILGGRSLARALLRFFRVAS